jgi:glycosyltransferase involved in cell wall biosynthesis
VVRHAETGYLMAYDATAGDWARAILELLADPAKRVRMGRAGRALAEREFSLAALTENVEWALETAAR